MLLKQAKNYIWAGLAALAFPLYFISIWISVTQNMASSQLMRVTNFLSFFPSFINDIWHITLLAIFCCGIAFTCSYKVLKNDNNWLRLTAYSIIGLASLLGIWLLFTLL